MDWSSVVSVAITGVVGIAGVAGTLWQGKRSREAQTRDLKRSLDAATENVKLGVAAETTRAHLTEKRRTYVGCLASFGRLTDTMAKLTAFTDEDGNVSEALASELSSSLAATINALTELQLIAPADVRQLAVRAQIILRDHDDSEEHGDKFRQARAELVRAMRADLGEPTGPY
jgi:hypothetical protein